MWKKDEARGIEVPLSNGATENSGNALPVGLSANRSVTPPQRNPSRTSASIGKGIIIVGDVTGTEDLFVDGSVEGKLTFENCSLTIGPNGNVKADVTAREVIVRGRVEGKVIGTDRVAISETGEVAGEVNTEKLSVEEGGILRGKVETGKPAPVFQLMIIKEQAPEAAIENVEVSAESVAE